MNTPASSPASSTAAGSETQLPGVRPETLRRARALPKVLLHEHLDGGLRVQTLLDLLRDRGITPPADTVETLTAWFRHNAHAGSLEKYLEGFALTVAAMATPAGLERVAFEAAEDALADNVVMAEFRIAPLLFEAHGVSGEAAVEAMLAGLARSALPSGLIVCGMRHEPPAATERAARLAARFFAKDQGRGVVGFDLAGAEKGFPPGEHQAAITVARDAGLGLTLHAGEADAAERVLEAARLGATRIGHGVRLVDALKDPARQALIDEARTRAIHLEVCPTSNVHTGAAASIASHPITDLWRAGISLSYHTDNQLMSVITPSEEAALLLAHTTLHDFELTAMAIQAAEHSFLPLETRKQAIDRIAGWPLWKPGA